MSLKDVVRITDYSFNVIGKTDNFLNFLIESCVSRYQECYDICMGDKFLNEMSLIILRGVEWVHGLFLFPLV